jgi:hypothetical protein
MARLYKVVKVIETNNRYGTERVYLEQCGISENMARDLAKSLNRSRNNLRTSYEVLPDVYA